ncbi:uncharacterized protein ACMZJ9_021675 [Mantella aurantiaca]
MKTIVLCTLLAVVLIQAAESVSQPKPNLRCHVCEVPAECKIRNEKDCAANEDTCTKIYRPIINPSGTENNNNYYASTAQGIMVWGRGCTTKAKCEKEKAKKNKGKLGVTVECCQGSLCNA